MLEEIFLGFVCFAMGGGCGMIYQQWRMKRPRKFVQEDRNAGLIRYQASKHGG
jgi:hypothetical protein